jgi:hypothetical protein
MPLAYVPDCRAALVGTDAMRLNCKSLTERGAGDGILDRPDMTDAAVLLLYHLTLAYAAIGLAVALAFVLVGLDRIDPAARGALAFRPLLLPGATLLWPLVLIRWIVLERRRTG